MDAKESASGRRAEAKRRFRRLMLVMLGVTGVVLVVAFSWLISTGSPLPLHFVIAVSLAVICSLMLAAGLMGLVFFSDASGADRNQHDPDA
jgi:uncharacterized protein (DUF983 family)